MIKADKSLPAPTAPGKGATYRPSLRSTPSARASGLGSQTATAAVAGQPMCGRAPRPVRLVVGRWFEGRAFRDRALSRRRAPS